MKSFSKNAILLFILLTTSHLYWSCKEQSKNQQTTGVTEKIDVLPSFNEGTSKTDIITFVETISDSTSNSFVKPEDRIACFDNDGTLWVEQPLPSQIFFVFERIKSLAKDHPEWANEMPFKAVIEDDLETIKTLHTGDILKLVGTAQASENVDQFDSVVTDWLATAKHPVMKKPYLELVYQPMLELLDYLRAHQFKIYIVSGGSQEFMRAWAPEVYGIPKEQIIGSTFKREVIIQGDSITITQNTEFDFNDDHEGKVLAISKFIGKKPILIGGNSDGDLEMMQYCDTNNPLPHLLIYVNHTDSDREFLYDEHTAMGTLKKGMDVALRRGWTIIDMKTEWNKVYPNE
ncbi:HAD family hydrolase [Aestuariibaculum lutulentum]|uniref:Haloacid dehalogenase-like hydrolase n=1 Tax=Aestuariibaculum lutulentum TaxID=2920935 RepID=A0ABS9RG13_9FLAO|nr:HAD family hydrolase [Aestuariibaculum lutulentum]MCH4551441.1 haloacid dehalogenase-like hydrolase [Aestuariibaculum lutulentum]